MDQFPPHFRFSGYLKKFQAFFYIPTLPIPCLAENPLSEPIQKLSNRGSALIMAAIFMLVATFLITIGVKLVSNASQDAKQRNLFVGEAENAARAGLVDALSWFGRQTTNAGYVSAYPDPGNSVFPIPEGSTAGATFQSGVSYVDQVFAPVNNTVNAQKSDTLDPAIGIVNEYPIDNGDPTKALYFARYEIRRQDPLHPNPTTTATPWVTQTPVATPDPNSIHDVTGPRNSQSLVNGDGLVWNVVSTGYIYKRMDKTGTFPFWTVPYNTLPNKVLATVRFSTEFRKLTLNMPTTATNITGAVYCQSTTQVSFNNANCVINGAVSTTGTYSIIAQKQDN